MHGSINARCCRLAFGSAALLVLTIAPYGIAFHGFVPGLEAATALAGKGGGGGGGNGGGNGGGGGNSGGGNGGNSGGGNSSGGNGNSGSGNNSGNGNGGGNNGNGNGNGADNGGGNSGAGKGQGAKSSHVNATTGDKVDVDGNKITVQHPDGLTEKIENGRFSMKDKLGRTIIDRRATPADASRLKAL
ncbi:hypothetical protein [Mesorhizobium sp. BH1-1-4]|uniref:hypothetical protein n=1 Tax=Mesorhizobium sp. BH1-1-4 TaxID=2876662 RepID=UPI001CD115D6|nr:hypothetical protein [Mesorhizobium sp. BH1-1-4]MBZ9996429.1 hypothetical protein [Mesorhizobium sp. BH1-1-4]